MAKKPVPLRQATTALASTGRQLDHVRYRGIAVGPGEDGQIAIWPQLGFWARAAYPPARDMWRKLTLTHWPFVLTRLSSRPDLPWTGSLYQAGTAKAHMDIATDDDVISTSVPCFSAPSRIGFGTSIWARDGVTSPDG
jgi:hypothetical protein